MSITLVSSAFLSERLAADATSASIDTTGGNLIVLGDYAFTTLPTWADSKSNTYTQAVSADYFSTATTRGFYKSVPTVGSGHNFTSGGAESAIAVACFAGVKATSPLDQTNATMNTFAGTSQAGSITPTEDNELVVAICSWSGLGHSVSIDGGFTIITQYNATSGAEKSAALAYLVQTTAAAANPTWTLSGGAQTYFPAGIMSFKVAAGTGITTPVGSLAATGQVAGLRIVASNQILIRPS